MDLPWGSEFSAKFITNVGLITSDGPHGVNIMAAEWTHHVSYSPGMIAVCIGFDKATDANIMKTKEFGVSLASNDQTILASVAGGSSGKEYDKIAAATKLGFGFVPSKHIKPPLVKGAALTLECRLVNASDVGDHRMFIGEVLDATSGAEPVAYHGGKYWHITSPAAKPSEKERARIHDIVESCRKKAQ